MDKRTSHLATTLVLIAGLLQVMSSCDHRNVEVSAPPTPSTSPPLVQTEDVPPTMAPPGTRPSTSLGLMLYESGDGSELAIWQMNGDGTGHRVVVQDKTISGWPEWPLWSPDGQVFAYVWAYRQADGITRQSVWLADRDGTHQRQLSEPAECAWYRWQCNNLLVICAGAGSTCDRYALAPERPQCFVYDLTTDEAREPDFPPDYEEYQTYLYSPPCNKVAALREGEQEFFVLDLQSGKRTTIFHMPAGHFLKKVVGDEQWSSDGSRLAFTYCYRRNDAEEMFCDLYVAQADSQELRRLTDFEGQYKGPGSPLIAGSLRWSPDGQWLAFLLQVKGAGLAHIAIVPAGGGPVTDLGIAWRSGRGPAWSPDSAKIAFISNVRFEEGKFADPYTDLGQWDVYTVDIYTREVRRLTNDQAMEMHVDWK